MKPTTGLVICLDELGRLLFIAAADLTDHHDALGLGVVLEIDQQVDELGADHRVAADADAGRLAEAGLGQGVDHFIGQGAASG